jgi:hypothetical protein
MPFLEILKSLKNQMIIELGMLFENWQKICL